MKSRITVDPTIHFGKPCVADTRIPIHSVLELVREGIGFNEIVTDYYSDITASDVQACIQYAIDIIAVEDLHLAPALP